LLSFRDITAGRTTDDGRWSDGPMMTTIASIGLHCIWPLKRASNNNPKAYSLFGPISM